MESHTKWREYDSDNIQERKPPVIVRAKIEITVNDFHEWIYRYPKEEYPKIMMPRSEIKINAEIDFFDRDLLEHLMSARARILA